MMDVSLAIPCMRERRGRYCFPCVTGLCPYGRTFVECYDYLDEETRNLFSELAVLRSEIINI